MSRRSRGHALFVTLVVLVLVALAVGLLASHYQFRSRMGSQESRRIHLQALTDAAVAETLANLAQSFSFVGVTERDFADGVLSSEVEVASGSRRIIVATATYRGWTRSVRVQVRIQDESLEVESWAPIRPHAD